MSLSTGTASFVVFKFDRMDVRELAEKLNSVKISRLENRRKGFTSGKLILDNEVNEDSIHGEILHVQFVEEKPRIDRAMLKAQIALHIDREKKARGVEFLSRVNRNNIKKAEEMLMLANAPYTRSGVEVMFDCSSGLGYFGSSSESKYDAFAVILRDNGIKSMREYHHLDEIQYMLTELLGEFSPQSVSLAPNGGAKFIGNHSSVMLGDCASDSVISNCAVKHERKCVKLGLVAEGSTFTLSDETAFSKFKVVEDKHDKKDIIERVACFERAYNNVNKVMEEFKGVKNG